MREILASFPENCTKAVEMSNALRIPHKLTISKSLTINYSIPDSVIVVGMGGSAIGGNLLKDLLWDSAPIPIEVCRDYVLPAYADERTLVFALSYSGGTEETLSGFIDALERGCMVVAVTSGGLLGEFSEKLSLPVVRLPPGLPPRSALPYLLFPLVVGLEKLGVVEVEDSDIDEAIATLRKMREELVPETSTQKNPAKSLALGIKDTIPAIYGFRQYQGVAFRMKTQLNENSKVPSKWESFPELNHNENVGWMGPESLTKRLSVILIRDPDEPKEIRVRIELTKQFVLDQRAANVLEIYARGKSRLAKMLSAVYMGDYASFYLAILYGVDPTPVNVIARIRRELKEKVDKAGELKRRFVKILEETKPVP